MSMFLTFTPWVLFALITNHSDWRIGLGVGLVAQLLVLARSRRVTLLDGAMVAFFAAVGLFALARPDSGFEPWVQGTATTWIALVAAASILARRPFTLAYSRDDVTPEIAASSIFLAINTRIAWVWTAAFAGMAAGAFIATAADVSALSTITTVALVFLAVRFTKRYPDQAMASLSSRRDRMPSFP